MLVAAPFFLEEEAMSQDGQVTSTALILGVAAFGLLTLGGALAYVYGVRIVKRDVPLADALIPGRLESRKPAPVAAAPCPPQRQPAAAKPAKAKRVGRKQAADRCARADLETAALLVAYGSPRDRS